MRKFWIGLLTVNATMIGFNIGSMLVNWQVTSLRVAAILMFVASSIVAFFRLKEGHDGDWD